MKKLLTVVLCVAVIFTFSFSGAFAATGTGDYNKTTAGEYLKDALDAVDGDAGDADGIWVKLVQDTNGTVTNAIVALNDSNITKTESELFAAGWYLVTSDVLEANQDKLLAETEDYYKATATSKTYVDTGALLVAMITTDALDSTNGDDVALDLVKAQFAADKQEALDALNSVSYSAYSTDEMKKDCGHDVKCSTYKEHVEKIVEDAIKTVNDMKVKDSTLASEMVTNKKTIDDTILGVYDGTKNGSYKGSQLLYEKGYGTSGNAVGTGIYELNKQYHDTNAGEYAFEIQNYATLGEYLDSSVSGNDAEDEAKHAALKAKVAADKAAYVKINDSTSEKEYADNMQEALNYLIDEDEITESTYVNYFTTECKGELNDEAADAVKAAKELKDEVATLAAETDSEGTLVRDADDVADILEAGLTAIYKTATVKSGTAAYTKPGETAHAAASAATIKGYCVEDVEDLYVGLDGSRLAYFKKWATTRLDREYTDADDDGTYYAKEYAEYAKLVESYKATIEAATKHTQVEKALKDFYKDLADIDTKDEVKADIAASNLLSQIGRAHV